MRNYFTKATHLLTKQKKLNQTQEQWNWWKI
jgi:hypothetical protein